MTSRVRVWRGETRFTLADVLVVLVILALLVSVALFRIVGLLDAAKERANASELDVVQMAQGVMMQEVKVVTIDPILTPTRDMTDVLGGFELYPRYMSDPTTHCLYGRTADGSVWQKPGCD